MNKKLILGILVLIVLVVAIFGVSKIMNSSSATGNAIKTTSERPVKEFVMDSFVEIVDGKPKPQYSLKEITVSKGDLVRIKITVTKGTHDFKIDEFGVYADTQLNKESVVEFVADKTGEFVYYCTKPGHRQNGHWGTLKVLE